MKKKKRMFFKKTMHLDILKEFARICQEKNKEIETTMQENTITPELTTFSKR